jgi:hypothetical protein
MTQLPTQLHVSFIGAVDDNMSVRIGLCCHKHRGTNTSALLDCLLGSPASSVE